MNVQIVDNFLDENEFDSLYKRIMGLDFPWYRQNYAGSPDEKNYKNNILFTHLFYRDNKINSSYSYILDPILLKLNPKIILRIKANLYPINDSLVEHSIHKDQDFPHNGAIFYLNTNNGFTILEDGTKINSQKNRMAFFDTSTPHKSTNCTDEKFRININFNYLI